ncbi:restriction endonuclease subunit S [Arthrobacter sp. NPDC093128]|uniref:restriction endonuclease subunit S n=1 Tax=Arthrobacter sp. NPDC093128 TaxID=3154979 RepID=UPI003436168E
MNFTTAGRINSVARARIRKGVGAPGDVILSHKGTVGKVAVAPDDSPEFVCSPQTTFWRSLDESVISQAYLRYILVSSDFARQLDLLKGQTDMAPYVSLTDQRSMTLTLPDIPQQRAIAEVLGALDDKITANTKLAEVSDQLAITMLLSLQPAVPLSVVVRYHKKTKNPESMGTAEAAHFSLPAFDAGRRPEVTPPTDIKSSKFSIEQPSVLISKLNPRFPRVWDVANVPDIPALASTEFLVLEPLYSSTTFLWAMLSQPAFGLALESKVAGTSGSHQRVKPADLLDTPVLDPRDMPASLRDQVTSLGRRGSQARTESSSLTQIRNSLLPQLMSGKLQVKDAETVLEGAGV